jgi:hypothetical protein
MNTIPKETQAVISEVLDMEEELNVDWDRVGETCDKEIKRINENGLGASINGLPYHFLEDYDIRRKDSNYGEAQRRKIKLLLRDENPGQSPI